MLGFGVSVWLNPLLGSSGTPVERDSVLLLEDGAKLLLETGGRVSIDEFSPSYFSSNLQFSDSLVFGQMYQDSTGLQPITVAGQRVGKLIDQSSSNHHAVQATESQRPYLRQSTDDDSKYYLNHDRTDDGLSVTLSSGTYSVGVATWSCAAIFEEVQKTTGTYNLNPSDSFAKVFVDRALTTNESLNLARWLEDKRSVASGATDVLRVYSNINSVSLSVSESGSSGSTWLLGDGQTATGTSCVKTITAPQTVIYRAVNPERVTVVNWGSKSLYGQIDLSKLVGLTTLNLSTNKLSGNINLSANPALTSLYLGSNLFCGTLSFSSNASLTAISVGTNQFSGDINFSANTVLQTAYLNSNKFSTFSGSIPATLGDFDVQDNVLTQAAVDAILAAFVAAGKSTGTRLLNLAGTGNAAPSVAGLASKVTLQNRGWTVTNN